ncbi:MAG: prolyl oligopeptidase, partial [Glaciecola sp.]
KGERWFQNRNSGLQNQPVFYVMDSPEDEGRVLLDPNTLSEAGTSAINNMAVTDDGALLAYAVSEAGSDWQTWSVRDVATGEDLPDTVRWSKFSGASWRKDNSGFYYGALDAPVEGQEYLAENRVLRVWFHAMGTDQSQDSLVFEAPDEPDTMPHAGVTDDGRYLLITRGRGTNPENDVRVLDLQNPDASYQPLVEGFDCVASPITNVGATFFLVTDLDAERRRVVKIDLSRPGIWTEVVPESADTLTDATFAGGKLVLTYLHHATSRLRVFNLDGTHDHDIELPGHGTVAGFTSRATSDVMHLPFTSFTDPGTILRHDLSTKETSVLRRSDFKLDPSDYITEQVFVASDDGTAQIPVFITRHKDVEPTGDVPVMLYAYGGFNIPMTPAFSIVRSVWCERGGVLAVACIRGGGEYGKAWHDAGRLENKQNCFDDFCAVARWFDTSGWSRPERIAINGGSNGGLLVGACLTQHPELFAAAVPEVGVLDVLRFHLFTIGWAWISDFGDPDIAKDYAIARKYSPLHNLVPGTKYPATMVMTGDHDDRVVPGHSFKFAAALQAAQGGDAPSLIRIATAAGHGAGKPTSKIIEERTDFLAFLEQSLGVAAERA